MPIQFITKDSPAPRPVWTFRDGVRLADHIRLSNFNRQTIVEFVGSGDFSTAFFERQRYEVEAGRDQEPLLYTPLYREISDPNLPRNVNVAKLGPAGVIFTEISEGGEIKFATVGDSTFTVPMRHFGVGIEYTEEMYVYNELWNIALVERQAGTAYNALLNHLHLAPILTASYTSANQTPAATDGTTLAEKYLRTIEAAIIAGKTDASNPRRGPYVLLVSSNNYFTVQRALTEVPQLGIGLQASEALAMIKAVVAYDGWTGQRGKTSVSYAGVTSGKGYLVNIGHQEADFQSYEKHGLRAESGNQDVSRLIVEQTVWHFRRGVYANPLAAVEEITWPTS